MGGVADLWGIGQQGIPEGVLGHPRQLGMGLPLAGGGGRQVVEQEVGRGGLRAAGLAMTKWFRPVGGIPWLRRGHGEEPRVGEMLEHGLGEVPGLPIPAQTPVGIKGSEMAAAMAMKSNAVSFRGVRFARPMGLV